jgi:hypothetical protein
VAQEPDKAAMAEAEEEGEEEEGEARDLIEEASAYAAQIVSQAVLDWEIGIASATFAGEPWPRARAASLPRLCCAWETVATHSPRPLLSSAPATGANFRPTHILSLPPHLSPPLPPSTPNRRGHALAGFTGG